MKISSCCPDVKGFSNFIWENKKNIAAVMLISAVAYSYFKSSEPQAFFDNIVPYPESSVTQDEISSHLADSLSQLNVDTIDVDTIDVDTIDVDTIDVDTIDVGAIEVGAIDVDEICERGF